MPADQPTFSRLIDAAKKTFLARNPDKKATKAAIARLLGVSDQTLSNWRGRGVPKEMMVDLAPLAGTTAEWINTGQHPVMMGGLSPSDAALLAAFHQLDQYEQARVLVEIECKAKLATITRAQAAASAIPAPDRRTGTGPPPVKERRRAS